MKSADPQSARLARLIALGVFITVFTCQAFYVRHLTQTPPDAWAQVDVAADHLGFDPYFHSQEYLVGFSYALSASFAAWMIARFVAARRTRSVAEAAGGLTLAGGIMVAGCFLIGCCGSPMLPIYIGLFGAKALQLGKPIMALISVVSVGCAYWCVSRRTNSEDCVDTCCK